MRAPKEKKRLLIRVLVTAVFLALFALALYLANRGWNGYTTTETTGIEYETAKVLSVLRDDTQTDSTIEGRRRGSMELELQILTGRYAGDQVTVTNYLSAMYNVYVGEGDTLSVRIDTTGVNTYQVSVYNYNRIPLIAAMVLVFAAALIAIGGRQGLWAFVGLVFTFVSVVYLLLPLTLRGWNSVLLAVAIVGLTSTVCFYLLGGWQPKSIGAALGCLCGVAFAAVLGSLAAGLLHISAYQMDEAEALMLVMSSTKLKLDGLMLSGILIAAEGAVMDVAMSVASAMDELKRKRPDIGPRELFRSGMRVGRDATGTMANTLVLAFTGSSLNMMLLIYSYDVSFQQLMNTDFVAVEIVRSLAGSMGIIFTVPCAAGITAWLLARRKPQGQAGPPEPGKKRKPSAAGKASGGEARL